MRMPETGVASLFWAAFARHVFSADLYKKYAREDTSYPLSPSKNTANSQKKHKNISKNMTMQHFFCIFA